MPEIDRQNPWNLRDIAFNPEWVRRPVYDLIRCTDTDSDHAGFLPDQQVSVLLAERRPANRTPKTYTTGSRSAVRIGRAFWN